MDFMRWWGAPGEWVEAPNERRNGWSGVLRVQDYPNLFYVKRQRNHFCRTVRHPLGWPTCSREWLYLHRLRDIGVITPTPVFHDIRETSDGLEAVLVTHDLKGFVALNMQTGLNEKQRRILAESVGTMLGKLHHARLQHSCLYDKHVMIKWEGEHAVAALLDLEKMHGRITRHGAARHDLAQLQRHQVIFNDSDWAHLLVFHQQAMTV